VGFQNWIRSSCDFGTSRSSTSKAGFRFEPPGARVLHRRYRAFRLEPSQFGTAIDAQFAGPARRVRFCSSGVSRVRSTSKRTGQCFVPRNGRGDQRNTRHGPGTYTSLTQVAADVLCISMDRVRMEIGDTRFPPAPAHGGSVTMASLGNAVHRACEGARQHALATAGYSNSDADLADVMRRIGRSIENTADFAPDEATARIYSMHQYGAVCVEVTADPDLGLVRVPRITGAYAVGRIVNPLMARSQAIGGMVFGIGMALLEHTRIDARNGRVVNGTLAEYLVPVNADVHGLDVVLIDDPDSLVNPLGVKGIAELTTIGVASAIANAVYHATGTRIRDLPITPEKLL